MSKDEVSVGIDLGTTNTLVCINKNSKLKCLKFAHSEMLPSIVYVNEDGSFDVGAVAQSKGLLDPKNRIKSSKTWMGDFNKKWTCNGKILSPTDVAREILIEVKKNVIKRLKCDEDTKINAVITVPVYFNSNQIDETRKAGQQAGLNVMRIVTEPMAAAIAYGTELDLNKKIFVVDLGGGTFDISILQCDSDNNSYANLELAGDKRLGGDDFDEVIYKYFISILEEDLGLDLSTQEASKLDYKEYNSMVSRLKNEAEQTKKELSDVESREIIIPNLFTYRGKEYNFETCLTRDKFNELADGLYKKISNITRELIEKGNIKVSEIDRVILVGGSCYIPRIREDIEKIFGNKVYSDMDLSTLVTKGACIVANSQSGIETVNISDIISHSLGIEVFSNGRNKLEKILVKNRKYPCKEKKLFTTNSDYQEVVQINVYEGEDKDNLDNDELYGSFILEGIEKAKKGVPQIEVEFEFDESRILKVTAKDLKTNSSKNVVMRKGEKIAIEQNQKPIDFLLLFDSSGSMSGTPIEQANQAATKLINEMIDFSCHRLGIINFDNEASLVCNLTNDKNKLKYSLDSIKANGCTNMYRAVELAIKNLNEDSKEKVIILLTDGAPYGEDGLNSDSNIIKICKEAQNNGIRVVCIGVGQGVNKELLERISSVSDGRRDYYGIDNMVQLTETFKRIIMSITTK